MSETTSTGAAEKPTAPAKPLDEFGTMAKDRLRATIEEYNVLAAQVKAANSDPADLLETLRDTYTDNPDVVKITEAIEKLDNQREQLYQKRDALLQPVVEQMVEQAKSGTEGLDAKVADLRSTINAGRKYITDMYGEDNLADLPALVGRRASSGGGGGTGARRIRGFDVYVNGTLATSKNGKGETVSNMATAAKDLGLETEVLRDAFFAAAGTDDSKKFPAEVTFHVSAGEGDERKQYEIRAVRVKQDEERATESGTPEAA